MKYYLKLITKNETFYAICVTTVKTDNRADFGNTVGISMESMRIRFSDLSAKKIKIRFRINHTDSRLVSDRKMTLLVLLALFRSITQYDAIMT